MGTNSILKVIAKRVGGALLIQNSPTMGFIFQKGKSNSENMLIDSVLLRGYWTMINDMELPKELKK